MLNTRTQNPLPSYTQNTVKKQCKLKFRPFEILAIKDGVIRASEMELVGTLMTIDALLVFLHPSHTMLLYIKIFEVESLFLWAFVVALEPTQKPREKGLSTSKVFSYMMLESQTFYP